MCITIFTLACYWISTTCCYSISVFTVLSFSTSCSIAACCSSCALKATCKVPLITCFSIKVSCRRIDIDISIITIRIARSCWTCQDRLTSLTYCTITAITTCLTCGSGCACGSSITFGTFHISNYSPAIIIFCIYIASRIVHVGIATISKSCRRYTTS